MARARVHHMRSGGSIPQPEPMHGSSPAYTNSDGGGNSTSPAYMAEGGKAKKWIAGATKHAHGQFRAKAEAAGKSTAEFAREKAAAPGKLGKQARLAKALMGLHK